MRSHSMIAAAACVLALLAANAVMAAEERVIPRGLRPAPNPNPDPPTPEPNPPKAQVNAPSPSLSRKMLGLGLTQTPPILWTPLPADDATAPQALNWAIQGISLHQDYMLQLYGESYTPALEPTITAVYYYDSVGYRTFSITASIWVHGGLRTATYQVSWPTGFYPAYLVIAHMYEGSTVTTLNGPLYLYDAVITTPPPSSPIIPK